MTLPAQQIPAAMETKHPHPRRVPELDGIRGLAMALVLIWHYVAGQVQTTAGSSAAYAIKLLSLTWTGVDLFFVLSGFLIGGILIDNRNASYFFRAFYFRRFCRIFPLYYLMLGIFAFVIFIGMSTTNAGLEWLFGDGFPLWSYATYLQNFHMAEAGRMGPHWLAVTWSLAIEEQFYLILPVMVRLLSPRLFPRVLIFLVVSAPLIRTALYFLHPQAGIPGYLLLPARWDALFLGVLGAWALRQEGARRWLATHQGWLYFVMASTGALAFGLLTKDQSIGSLGMTFGGHTVLALFSLALILNVLLTPEGRLARGMRNTVLIWMGTVSYGIYLFHEPVAGLLHYFVRGQAPRIATVADAGVTLLALFVTFALAVLSWRWLERPIVSLGQRIKYDA
jgi:peptidoglycan/LPS O-acetylase OafA/YrhL